MYQNATKKEKKTPRIPVFFRSEKKSLHVKKVFLNGALLKEKLIVDSKTCSEPIRNFCMPSFSSSCFFHVARREEPEPTKAAALPGVSAPGQHPNQHQFPCRSRRQGQPPGPGTGAPALPQHGRLLLSPWTLQSDTLPKRLRKGRTSSGSSPSAWHFPT